MNHSAFKKHKRQHYNCHKKDKKHYEKIVRQAAKKMAMMP